LDDIINTLRALGRATSGGIYKYISYDIVKNLRELIESDAWNKVKNNRNLDSELEKHKQSKRTIQKWLSKLEAEGLVTKDDYYVYSLTDKGMKLNILPNIYGRMLLSSLMNLPWYETKERNIIKERNIVEFVKRVGTLMLYIFITNLRPALYSSTPSELLDKGSMNWIKDTIQLDLMFFSFENIFLRTKPMNQRQTQFISDESDYYMLLGILKKKFPKYYKVLKNADTVFSEKVIERQR
jgi:hypothetical protein